MSIDFHSIAVPLDAAAVQAIRADPQLWRTAVDQPPFTRFWGDEPLPDISRELLSEVPDGTRWVGHFTDRSHTQAEYLLDPVAYRAARTWELRGRSMPYRIINGDEIFADHANDDFPWRCSTRTFLAEAVEQIDNLDLTAVRHEFSVAQMDELGVYKVDRAEDDSTAFDRIHTDLLAYADHCRRVIAQNLDLIITLH